nr:integrase core domain-containing protein [Bartonella tamiae]
MTQLHGAPLHPLTQGKIERWHQTMKNSILLEHYFYPEYLEQQITACVDYYNNHRYHKSLNNLTPADVYHGKGEKILKQRTVIKFRTLQNRSLIYYKTAA